MNWKLYYIPLVGLPNDGVEFYTTIGEKDEDFDIHMIDGEVVITRGDKQVEWHICVKNNYAKKLPYKYINTSDRQYLNRTIKERS